MNREKDFRVEFLPLLERLLVRTLLLTASFSVRNVLMCSSLISLLNLWSEAGGFYEHLQNGNLRLVYV